MTYEPSIFDFDDDFQPEIHPPTQHYLDQSHMSLQTITLKHIVDLQVGRETDILVCEMILNQDRLMCRTDPINRDGEPQFHWGHPHGHDFAPEYSSDGSSWKVILTWAFAKYRAIFELNAHSMTDKSQFWCSFNGGKDFALAPTFELAVCKAALMLHLRNRR